MKWRGLGFAALAALGGCTSILGGFTVGDGGTDDGGDATLDGAPEVGNDVVTIDAPKDAPVDAPPEGPSCGAPQEACCANNPKCNGASVQCCSNNMCSDTSSDPMNCGACGHDCLGAGCTNGMCVPQSLFTGTSPYPGRIRDAMNNLVWMDRDLDDAGNQNGNVFVCAKQSCSATKLLSGLTYMQDIVVDVPNPSTVYVSAGGLQLESCAIAGCNNTPTITAVGSSSGPGGLAYRNSTIYSTLNLDAYQFQVDGTGVIELGTGNEPANEFEAPLGSSWIYWNSGPSGSSQLRFGKDGQAGSSTPFWTSTQGISHVTSDVGFVAWSVYNGTGQDIYACPVGGAYCNTPTPITTGVQLSYMRGGLGMDPGNDEVLWLTVPSSKEVKAFACAAASCTTPRLVADVTTKNTATAGAIIADGKFYYFTLSDGSADTLYRVAK